MTNENNQTELASRVETLEAKVKELVKLNQELGGILAVTNLGCMAHAMKTKTLEQKVHALSELAGYNHEAISEQAKKKSAFDATPSRN